MAAEQLKQVLNGLKRRAAWIGGTSGVLWGVSAGLLCLIAGVWLDLVLDFPTALRTATLVAAAVATAAVIGFFALRRIDSAILAGRLDLIGRTGGQIRSGVDLSDGTRPFSESHRPDVTRALAVMAVERAAGLAAAVPKAAAVPVRPVKRSGIGLLAALAVPAAFALFMPRLFATEWQRFFDPQGDHPPFSQVVFHVEPQGAKVIYGGSLDIHATVEGPAVDNLQLVLEPRGEGGETETLPMFPESGGKWRASLTNITKPQRYFVRAGSARSRRFDLDVITVPKIEDVRVRITPPAYTRRPVYDGPVPREGISGLAGARVQFTVRSNRPLSSGRIRFTAGQEKSTIVLKPTTPNGHEVGGEFAISKSGRLDLVVTDAARQDSQEPFSAQVTKLIDDYPFVRLLQPRPVSFATPTANVPVVISAEDDYGITRLQLFRSLNDSRALPMEVRVAQPPAPRAYEVTYLPFAQFGLEPGDEIKLFARVVDNDPSAVPGPGKGSESSIALIRIISQEDFDRMQRTRDGMKLLMSKYEQVRRRLEALASKAEQLQKKLDKAAGDKALSQELKEELQQLAQQMQRDAEELRKLADSKLPYDLDKKLSPQLKQLAEQLQQLAKQMQGAANKKNATNKEARDALKNMLKQLGARRTEFQKQSMLPLDLLSKVLPLSQAESRFVQIYRRQRELADRLASLKGRDGQADAALKRRMRDLEDEQRRIRKDLAELLEDIETAANRLPDDPRVKKLRDTALKFVKDVRASGASMAMTDAETGLSEYSGTRGHAGGKKAADILEKFLVKCRGMGANGEAGNCLGGFSPSLGNSLATTLGQLLRDAGMMPGQGQGFGAGGSGGGYSARRNTAQNVGLYGSQPAFDQAADSRMGSGAKAEPGAGRGRSYGRSGPQSPGADYRTTADTRASGSGEAVVPLPYRRKVAKYFQRIADEVGDR